MEELNTNINSDAESKDVLSVSSAVFDNDNKTYFTCIVECRSLGRIPFTYDCSGKDDNKSHIAKEVGDLFREKKIEISDHIHNIERERTQKEKEVRGKRNRLLKECDFFIFPDYPSSDEDRECVKSYRQSLRDITEQVGFPFDVVWPEKPDCLK